MLELQDLHINFFEKFVELIKMNCYECCDLHHGRGMNINGNISLLEKVWIASGVPAPAKNSTFPVFNTEYPPESNQLQSQRAVALD